MTGGTLALLLLVWAVVLVPGLVRDWRRSPVASADDFAEAMQRLAGSRDSRYVVVPGSAQRRVVHPPGVVARRQRRRRRGVLLRLAGSTAVSLVLALLLQRPVAWTLLGLMVATTVGYVTVLRLLTVRAERTRQVVLLHPAGRVDASDGDAVAATAPPAVDDAEPGQSGPEQPGGVVPAGRVVRDAVVAQ